MIEEGKTAPAFTLRDKDGTKHQLSALDATFTVLFFYPKDNTPGCTLEAKGFSTSRKKLENLGVAVLGISGGDEKSKTTFCKKHNIQIPLLSDPEFKVSQKYGVYGKKQFMGRSFMGINRTTYVLDGSRRVLKRYDKVKPDGHVAEVLRLIKELS